MARKIVVYNKATRQIVAISDYDSKAATNVDWLKSLTDEGLGYVDVDSVMTAADFSRRTVDALVVDKSSEASITEAKFPRADVVTLIVPKSVKQRSTVRITVTVMDADEVSVKPISGIVHFEVYYPDKGDLHRDGDITLVGGSGYADVPFPDLVGSGDTIVWRVLVRVAKDDNALMSASAFVEMTL